MFSAVADTHAVIWYLYADGRLSASARDAIERAAAGGDQVAFSAITLAEIVYLADRIIAATALALGMPLISRDGKIRLSGVSTIW